jgi:hypothetical protein
MPGINEIMNFIEKLSKVLKGKMVEILPLHSSIP